MKVLRRKTLMIKADVYVINTCSVTENADKECRYLVRKIQRKSPESLVVITGCYAQLKPKKFPRFPGVDLVLGAAEKFNIASHLRELTKGQLSAYMQVVISARLLEFKPSFL
jgi:threonylcarbamoyladenosine tRNA methylthiotransferase MtaB